jgi:hypothetical protein
MSTTPKKEEKVTTETPKPQTKCGLIMPISGFGDYTADHWSRVKTILVEAVNKAGFDAELVSDSDEVSVIQKNIVQNIYENEIIVCDISGRNANVMFELGMRLTFDKLIVIVKDDETQNPFDTNIIEYVGYRKDLRYDDIQSFKRKLADKINATHKKKDDPKYSPFIKHFGDFQVPKIESKEVEPLQFLLNEMSNLRREIKFMRNENLHHVEHVVPDSVRLKKLTTFTPSINVIRHLLKDDPNFEKLSPKDQEIYMMNFINSYEPQDSKT